MLLCSIVLYGALFLFKANRGKHQVEETHVSELLIHQRQLTSNRHEVSCQGLGFARAGDFLVEFCTKEGLLKAQRNSRHHQAGCKPQGGRFLPLDGFSSETTPHSYWKGHVVGKKPHKSL